jgi:adenylate cyclase
VSAIPNDVRARPKLRLSPASLKWRIVIFFVSLLVTIQLFGALAIRYTLDQSTRANMAEIMDVGAHVAERVIREASAQGLPGADTAYRVRDFAGLDVMLVRGGPRPELIATTLSVGEGPQHPEFLQPGKLETFGVQQASGGAETYFRTGEVRGRDGQPYRFVLLRDVGTSRQSFLFLEWLLIALSIAGLLITLAASIRIAQRITAPVSSLADAARRIAEGDYGRPVEVREKDEISDLATAFNQMSAGLKERDQVRELLGKVTSPAVATALLSRDIELGGEEREVTVMFCDIRNFTALCESLSPRETVNLLNRYLQIITDVIEHYEGVVDKYMGDGVMAIFGAPVGRHDDAVRAVKAALQIERRIEQLARTLRRENLPHPAVGIGINTCKALAGNVGTSSRLNYTVLGDGVNLASRLEGLTKRYLVPTVAGESTQRLVTDVLYLDIDQVRVKGKAQPVRLFRPLGHANDVDAVLRHLVERHHEAVALYRGREWKKAARLFEAEQAIPELKRIAELYLGYIRHYSQPQYEASWDGVFTLYDK